MAQMAIIYVLGHLQNDPYRTSIATPDGSELTALVNKQSIA